MAASGLDVSRARRETPATRSIAHFNNAGAALCPAAVTKAQVDHIELEAKLGGYEAAAMRQPEIDAVYTSVAALINADGPDEIAIVENATVAWDMAFYAVAGTFGPGDRILTAEAEYAANFVAYLQVARRTGCSIEVIPSSAATGETDVAALEAMLLDGGVKLVSISHVPSNGGLVNPAAAIGRVAKEHGALYLLDACQSVGQLPIDVDEIQCDMLSATGRKYLRGPRGVGFLYVRRELLTPSLEPPTIDHYAAPWTAPDQYTLRPDAKRFENWENNYAAKLGLGVAVDYALGWGVDSIWARVRMLADTLRCRLRAVPGVTVHDIGAVQCGIVTFTCDAEPADAIQQRLAAAGVHVSVTAPETTVLDAARRGLPALCRASVHYYNDSHDIDRLMATLTRSDTGGHVGGDSCDGDGHGDGVTSTPRPKL